MERLSTRAANPSFRRPGFATDMRRWLFGGCVLAIVLAVLWLERRREQPTLFEPYVRDIEPAPVCPWREPEGDLQRFFPGGATYSSETRILSGVRVELAKQLGRLPEAEENSITLYRVFAGSNRVGTVLTRRVKGEHGGIELVLALNGSHEVDGVRLQRIREPEAISKCLHDPGWLGQFRGRSHHRGWDSDDVRGLPKEAHISARAIREGIRSLLILLAAAESTERPPKREPHH